MEHSTTLDLAPVMSIAVQGIMAVLAATATWAAAWVKRKAHIDAQGLMAQQLDVLMSQAINFAQGHLMTLLGNTDFAKVETRNTALQIGLSFLSSQAPGLLSELGLTEQHVSDLLLAKMAKLDPTLVLPGTVPLPSVTAQAAVSG